MPSKNDDLRLHREQATREELVRDMRVAAEKVAGGQSATQERLVELGLCEFSLLSGEASSVFMLIGHIVGALIDHKVDPGKIISVMKGDYDLGDRHDITVSRRVQLGNFVAFAKRQLWAVTGTAAGVDPVLAFLVDMFILTIQAYPGLGTRSPA